MRIEKSPEVLSSGLVVAAEMDDSRIPKVIEYLVTVWPEMAVTIDKEVRGWYPVIVGFDPKARGHYSGAANDPEWIYSSLDDPLGGAEGLLHEYGHLDLKRRGVHYESWTAVLKNDPGELYVSPVRKDKKRPMGAVLHAQYSYLYVTTFDCRAWELGLMDRETLTLNQARMAEGVAEIEANVKPTADGREFIEHLIAWSHALARYNPDEDHMAESEWRRLGASIPPARSR